MDNQLHKYDWVREEASQSGCHCKYHLVIVLNIPFSRSVIIITLPKVWNSIGVQVNIYIYIYIRNVFSLHSLFLITDFRLCTPVISVQAALLCNNLFLQQPVVKLCSMVILTVRFLEYLNTLVAEIILL